MTTPEIGAFLRGYSGFVPGLLAFVVIGWLAAPRVSALLGVGRIHAMALVVGAGLVVSATMTPGYDALVGGAVGSGSCDFTRVALPSLNQLRWPGEVLLNILLFVPLGLAIGWCPPSRARLATAGLAYALPLVAEATQLVVIQLGRACQSGDVVDNLTGLTLGIVAASGLQWFGRVRRERGTIPPMPRLPIGGLAALALFALVTTILVQQPSAPAGVPSLPAGPTSIPEPSPSGDTVQVNSVQALLDALADDKVGEIIVADGRYQLSAAASQEPDSLWIGERFSGRTNPVLVRAETDGGVIFDGSETGGSFGGMTFAEGAHHQTWQGFTFADGQVTETGVIVFGGYAGRAAPHHITLRNITIPASVLGRATSASAVGLDHAIYVSQAVGGPHDLLLEGIAVDGRGGLASAIVFFHSDAANQNAWNVTIRRIAVTGTQQAIMLWDPTLRDITVDTAIIRDTLSAAVSYESPGASGIVFANITSTGSGSGRGFVSSLGPSPPGVTLRNNSFR